jgi:hypothetical protein
MFDVQTKKGAFLLLVQTWALAAGSQRNSDPRFKARFAIGCLEDALALDEALIPDDVVDACDEYMNWQDQKGGEDIPCPTWFKPQRNAQGNNAYPWSKVE